MLDVIIGKGKIKDKKTNLFHSVKDKTDFNLKRFTGRKAVTFKANPTYDILVRYKKSSFPLDLIHCSPFHR